MDSTNTLAILDQHELAKVQPLDQNPAAVYLANLRPSGRRSQRDALDRMAAILTNGETTDGLKIPWQNIRYQHAQAIRSVLVERYQPATTNRMLTALKGVAKQAWLLKQMTAGDYLTIREVKRLEGETILAGRYVNEAETTRLMQTCEHDKRVVADRDAAIIALMYAGGCRREEVVRLDLKDFDQDTGKLIVHGKRGKVREIFIKNGAFAAMVNWLKSRGSEQGPLFIHVNKSGKYLFRRLTNQAVYFMLESRRELAGLKPLAPHDLRRSCATDMLEHGIDPITTARFLGHTSVNTTMRYDRRPETAKKKAAQTMQIYYKPRAT